MTHRAELYSELGAKHSLFDFNLHIPANAAWFAVSRDSDEQLDDLKLEQ